MGKGSGGGIWWRGFAIATIAAATELSVFATPIQAAEDAKGVYLLGSKTSLAGVVPPPGTYVTFYDYYYTGSASGAAANSIILREVGNLTLELDIEVEIDLDAQSFLAAPTFLWVSPHKVLGGNLGLGVLVPVGWQDLSADIDALATLTLTNGITLQREGRLSINDDTFNFGDPLLLATLGWHQGNWHWNVAGLLNVPIGAYSENNLLNMGFNRWAFDATAAVTWLNPQTGLEVSGAAGFTFNGENPDTDYETGTEFHVEFALMQNLSKAFAIGLVGYHYEQVTGDSGPGATLGSFKGEVTALGPNINYNFQLGATPVSTSLRWLHEFDAKNRLEGDAGLLVVTIPLGGAHQ